MITTIDTTEIRERSKKKKQVPSPPFALSVSDRLPRRIYRVCLQFLSVSKGCVYNVIIVWSSVTLCHVVCKTRALRLRMITRVVLIVDRSSRAG